MSDTQPIVFVTGVSGDIGQGIVRGLRKSRLNPWIVGVDMVPDNVGFLHCDASVVAPPMRDPTYREFLLELVGAHPRSLFLSGIDSELLELAPWREDLESKGCTVVGSSPELIAIFADKYQTVRWFEDAGLPAPQTFSLDDEMSAAEAAEALSLPLVFKTRQGRGSTEVFVVSDVDELERLRATHGPSIAQAYIDGPEFTVATLFDRTGTFRDRLIMRRRLRGGRTVWAQVEENAAIDRLIEQFAEQVNARGPVNLQLRISSDGTPFVFEVNARFSGSTGIRVAAGYNEPARVLAHFGLGEAIERQPVATGTQVYRQLTEIVVAP